jgi:hypothetical protein
MPAPVGVLDGCKIIANDDHGLLADCTRTGLPRGGAWLSGWSPALLAAGAAGLVLLAMPSLLAAYPLFILSHMLVLAIACLALNLLYGTAGSLSLAQLRGLARYRTAKRLILLGRAPEGRHYTGAGGGAGVAVILGGGWAGKASLSLSSKRRSSGSGSV